MVELCLSVLGESTLYLNLPVAECSCEEKSSDLLKADERTLKEANTKT
jgi:hypothetical protein